MAYNFFALMGRMKYIDRWGLMRNTQVENIQEHSHMVAVLAHALAVIGREKFGGSGRCRTVPRRFGDFDRRPAHPGEVR